MKYLLTILFTIALLIAFGKDSKIPTMSNTTKAHILSIDNNVSLNSLSYTITKYSKNDTEKARDIMFWIHNNISYDQKLSNMFGKYDYSRNSYLYNLDSTTNHYKNVFKYKKATCVGYAHIFHFLAEKNDLDVSVITGSARKENSLEELDGVSGHAWTVCNIDHELLYVDACWNVITYDEYEFTKRHSIREIMFTHKFDGNVEYSSFSINSMYIFDFEKEDYNINDLDKDYNTWKVVQGFTCKYMVDKKETIYLLFKDTKYAITKFRNFLNKPKVEEKKVEKVIVKNETVSKPKVLTISDSEFKSKTFYSYYKYQESLALYVKDYYTKKGLHKTANTSYKEIKYSKKKDYMKQLKKYRKMFN